MTRTGMLSRVITSWGGTVSVTVRRLTRTIRSIVGTSRISPGPRVSHQPPEPEDHPALVLPEHADGGARGRDSEHREDDDDDDDRDDRMRSGHQLPFLGLADAQRQAGDAFDHYAVALVQRLLVRQ